MPSLSALAVVAWVVSLRTTAVSILWLGVLVCSIGVIIAAIVGLVIPNVRSWRTVLGLTTADLLLGAITAILDHTGYAH